MKIEIIQFEENHRERLKLIYLEVRQTHFNWLPQEYFDLSSFDKDTEGEFIMVAKVDNEIVGFASVWLHDNFLHHLYVSNYFQGKGIGTLLVKSVLKLVNSEITLKCLKKNMMGIRFYLKNGWESVSEGVSSEGEYILFKYPMN